MDDCKSIIAHSSKYISVGLERRLAIKRHYSSYGRHKLSFHSQGQVAQTTSNWSSGDPKPSPGLHLYKRTPVSKIKSLSIPICMATRRMHTRVHILIGKLRSSLPRVPLFCCPDSNDKYTQFKPECFQSTNCTQADEDAGRQSPE